MIKTNKMFLIASAMILSVSAQAFTLKGVVVDSSTKEPLIGATVQVGGTTTGVITDIDGRFEIDNIKSKACTLIIQYVSYKTQEIVVEKGQKDELVIALAPDNQQLDEVTVVARKNLENERSLMMERQKSSVAIENIGAKEMSAKGISNVEEGVKKITGVSVASAGQIIVRGLGDRYSTTTLNGLPIASPNPDHKLIPLNLFPASTVKNITVSKVYEANSFADYSGAHIDIGTKEQTGEDFFSLSFSTGGKFNTLGKDTYRMDHDGTLFKTPSLDSKIRNMKLIDFEEYALKNKLFNTSFDVSQNKALPEFGGNIGFGKTFDINGNSLSLLASMGVSNEQQTMQDASVRTLEATGTTLYDFTYNSYSNELKIAGLGSLGYTFRGQDQLNYTFFYARNAVDDYMYREGSSPEDTGLIGSNSVTHIYTLQNHQLNGRHFFGEQWSVNWGGSYSKTSSDEPDRRQVMFIKKNNTVDFYNRNRQETMRYFGTLDENEWVGNLAGEYKWNSQNKLQAGFTYKDKARDYFSTRFYYDLNRLNPTMTEDDIYTPSQFITQEAVGNGMVVISRSQQPKDSYTAGSKIYAGYILADIYPVEELLVNVGVRYESSKQWVDYAEDSGKLQRRDLNGNDLFPALNLRYQFDKKNSLRLSFSRTVTRPSFIEMAPFLYQESYGSAQIRGNADLQNGYNYNLDLRYEFFTENGDMFSATAYYKHLEDPIEQIQQLSGGTSTIHSFQNANNGMATGVEVEVRKELVRALKLGVNASFMYTDVKLPEGGAYTNTQRALQGASPYLVNADLTYSPILGDAGQLSAALVYNLQGPRIQSVGVSGLGDVKQQPVHTMNFVSSFKFNEKVSLKLQINDLLNQPVVFKQEVPSTGEKVEVERFKRGSSFEIGVTYNL